jgi:glutamate racemase
MQLVVKKLMSPNNAPIGVFDSGVGGLSVLRQIRTQMPAESVLYFADQGHVPYGRRRLGEVRAFSEEITRFLLSLGAKLIVVACNAASAAALYHLRETFPWNQQSSRRPNLHTQVLLAYLRPLPLSRERFTHL